MNLSLISFTFVVNMERRNCCWRPPSKPGLDMNRNQQTTNYKLSITNYLHLSCNDRDKGAEVTFTLQSLGGSGGPTLQHHCVSFSGGPRIFLLLSPLFYDGHIFHMIVFIATIVNSDIYIWSKPAGIMWKVQGWSCPPREFVAQHNMVPSNHDDRGDWCSRWYNLSGNGHWP